MQSEIKFPYEISFVDCDPSDAVRFQVEQNLSKVSRICTRVTDCKVTIRIPHKHSLNRFFHINVSLDLPGKRIAATREPEAKEEHMEIRKAINDTFQKLLRQTEDFMKARKIYA